MKSLLDKFKYAFRGLILGFLDHSIQLQLGLMVIAIIAGFIFHFTLLEWCVLLLCCVLVVCLEFVNTVLERIADFVEPSKHEKIRDIKDMGAGFVLFASIVVLIVGMLLVGSKLL